MTEKKAYEDKYFRDQDAILVERLRKEREKRIETERKKETVAEQERLRDLHWMCCPKCGHSMAEKTLGGVVVDICSLCEGIFFDRGEIEELLVNQQANARRGFFRRVLGLGD